MRATDRHARAARVLECLWPRVLVNGGLALSVAVAAAYDTIIIIPAGAFFAPCCGSNAEN